ncbi:MAG: SpoIIE family protein phosphatase [bacterium]|nr:SpoIIE family protein phosphatase [bacterium]
MTLYTVMPLIMASIAAYVGTYYLVMYLKRRKEITNLTFAFACFAVAIYDISCFGLYNSSSVAQGMEWQRWNFTGVALIGVSFLWFTHNFVQKKINIVVKGLFVYLLGMIGFFQFYTGHLGLSLNNPMPRTVQIAGLFDITYYEVEPGLLIVLMMLVTLLGMFYIIKILVQYYLREKEKEALYIIICIILFFSGTINDLLAASGLYAFIYLVEYFYSVVILAMAYAMLNRFVKLHLEVEELNSGLEDKVKERTEQLESAMDELSVMNDELVSARDALWGEMMIAKKIQTALLPEAPVIKNYEISGFMNPADEVGGDYYDIINVRGLDWLVIGDVSGHGVPAGLIMMMVQTSIHIALNENPGIDPASLITTINKTITENIKRLDEDKYMTLTVLAVQQNGKFVYSGLHQDILIYRSMSSDLEVVETNGMWIGVMDDIEDLNPNGSFQLDKDDIMLLYTDGVTEAAQKDTMFGDDGLKNAFKNYAHLPVSQIQDNIVGDLEQFQANDDVTMLIVKRVA